MTDSWLKEVRSDVVRQLQALIADRNNQTFVRDDYREVADLTLMLLDAGPPQPRFRRPGAYHRARYMAEVSGLSDRRVEYSQLEIGIFFCKFNLKLTDDNSSTTRHFKTWLKAQEYK